MNQTLQYSIAADGCLKQAARNAKPVLVNDRGPEMTVKARNLYCVSKNISMNSTIEVCHGKIKSFIALRFG